MSSFAASLAYRDRSPPPAGKVNFQIPIRGLIDRKMAARVEREISEIPANGQAHITIDSRGGEAMAAVAIGRTLLACRGHTIATVVGQCDSAAVLVLASCRSRFAGDSARFTMHATAGDVPVKVSGRPTSEALQAEARRLDSIDQSVRSFISIRIGCSVAELVALERREAVLDARQALDLGLLTRVFGHPEWAQERKARHEAAAAMLASTRATIAASKLPFTKRHMAQLAALMRHRGEPLILGVSRGYLIRKLDDDHQ